jgi:hypothetical protein
LKNPLTCTWVSLLVRSRSKASTETFQFLVIFFYPFSRIFLFSYLGFYPIFFFLSRSLVYLLCFLHRTVIILKQSVICLF